jgi:hypothetical protein
LPRAPSGLSLVPADVAGAGREHTVRLQSNLLWNAFDRLSQEITSSDAIVEVGPVALTGLVATSGYVLLNTRAGYWLLSLLTSQPLWKQFDPLEVLSAGEEEAGAGRSAGEQEETLLSLVE